MNIYIVSGLAFAGGLGLAFAATALTTPASEPEPPFNYDAAPRKERLAFLSAEAAPISESIRATIGDQMQMKEPLLNPEARRITYRIEVDRFGVAKFNARSMKMNLYPAHCLVYLEGTLAENGVSVVQKFIAGNGTGRLTQMVLSPRVCERFADS